MSPAQQAVSDVRNTTLRDWQRVLTSGGTLARYVSGASGTGKSHLLRAVQGQEYRRVSLTARELLPALVEALHERLTTRDAQLTRDARPLAALRAVRPDLTWPLVVSGSAAEQSHTESESVAEVALGVVAQALVRLAQENAGLLLVVDELERATPDDLRTLLSCWRAFTLRAAPVLLLLAGQEETPAWLQEMRRMAVLTQGAEVQQYAMTALAETGMQGLVQEVLGLADVPLGEWLCRRAEGNPLWAVHLLGHLRAGGFLRLMSGAWIFTPPPLEVLPDGLGALLRARWHQGQQDAAVRDVLDVLALADHPLSLTELPALTSLTPAELRRAVERAQGQGLLRRDPLDGQVLFSLSHPSFAEVGRQNLAAERETYLRSRLCTLSTNPHERARQARLAHLPDAPTLTWEALRAAQAAQAWALIAEHCGALLNAQDRSACQEGGERADPQQGQRALRKLLGQAQVQLGQYREAVQTLSELADPDTETAESLVRAWLDLGEYQAGLAFLEGLPRPLIPNLRVLQARLQLHLGQLEDSRAELDRLLTLPDVNLAQVYLTRANHALLAHDGPRLSAEAREALKYVSTDSERADALNYLGLGSTWQGHADEALAAFQECSHLLRQAGREGAMQALYGNLSNLHIYAARFREAQQVQATALSLARCGSTKLVEMNATGALGMIGVMLGDEGGLQHIRTWQAHYQAQVPAGAPYVTLHAASAHALFGDDVRAAEYLSLYPPEATASMGYGPITLAQVNLMLGRTEEARRVLESAPSYENDPVGALHLALTRAHLHMQDGQYDLAVTILQEGLSSPHLPPFPSVAAEYHWALLAARLHQQAPQEELQALGSLVFDFLRSSGGRGHLLLLDRLRPHDLNARHACLRPADQSARPQPKQAFLRTLGHFDLEENGELRVWKGRKVRELLALLLCALVSQGRPARPREALVLSLWPDLPEKQAEANFRKTLSRLRGTLGSAGCVESTRNGYALSHLHADLTFFLRALEGRDLSAACAWYDGPFLPGIDLPEVTELRDALHARWRDAALTLLGEPGQTPRQVTALLRPLLRDDPFDPQALEYLGALDPGLPEVHQLSLTLRDQHLAELGEVAPEVQRLLARHH